MAASLDLKSYHVEQIANHRLNMLFLTLTGGAHELLADGAASAEDPSWWLSGPPRLPNCRENPLWDDDAAQPAAPVDSTSEVSLAWQWRHVQVLRSPSHK